MRNANALPDVTSSQCPPLDVRITKSLLGYGLIAGPIYVVVAAAQAVTRAGFDPTRHAVSQLANGSLGWIQIANFVVTGAMTIAAAVGIGRALPPRRHARWSAVLLAGYGVALIVTGARCGRIRPVASRRALRPEWPP